MFPMTATNTTYPKKILYRKETRFVFTLLCKTGKFIDLFLRFYNFVCLMHP